MLCVQAAVQEDVLLALQLGDLKLLDSESMHIYILLAHQHRLRVQEYMYVYMHVLTETMLVC